MSKKNIAHSEKKRLDVCWVNKSIARSLKTELRVFCKLVPGRGGLEDKKKKLGAGGIWFGYRDRAGHGNELK